jgi:chromosome segregation ATPase
MFVKGIAAMFEIAIALLLDSESVIMAFSSFEEILGFLQRTLPGATQVESVLSRASRLHITSESLKELDDEFQSIQEQVHVYGRDNPALEELFRGDTVLKDIRDVLTAANKQCASLKKENDSLQQQVNHSRSAMNDMRAEADQCHITIAHLKQVNAKLSAEKLALQEEVKRLREAAGLPEMRRVSSHEG